MPNKPLDLDLRFKIRFEVSLIHMFLKQFTTENRYFITEMPADL